MCTMGVTGVVMWFTGLAVDFRSALDPPIRESGEQGSALTMKLHELWSKLLVSPL